MEALRDFGLTENESKVYLALTELGDSTATPIRNKTGLHASRVYEALSTLINKGMVSYFLRNNVKHFKAQDPEVMFDIMEQRREKLKQAIPQIKILANKEEDHYSVSLYEGDKAFKQLYDRVLESLTSKDEILVFGAQPETLHFIGTTFFKEFTKRRIRKKINMRLIFSYDAKDTAKKYAKKPYTKARVLPKKTIVPASMNIYPEKVSVLLMKEKPLVFHLDCKEVAESYKSYFEFVWISSRKI